MKKVILAVSLIAGFMCGSAMATKSSTTGTNRATGGMTASQLQAQAQALCEANSACSQTFTFTNEAAAKSFIQGMGATGAILSIIASDASTFTVGTTNRMLR